MHCSGEEHASQSYSDALLIGAHLPIEPADMTLWRRHTTQLRSFPSASLSLLLLREDGASTGADATVATDHASQLGMGVCVWRREMLLRRLPRLASTLADPEHPHARESDPHLQRYYYMHASLLLWQEAVGVRAPASLRYIWRVEPDVLFSSPLPSLLTLSNASDADVLLPSYKHERRFPVRFGHWAANANLSFLQGVPANERLHSLVSIGRFSLRFLRLMKTRYWATGCTGYEELLLPVACKTASRGAGGFLCKLGAFGSNPWSPWEVPSLGIARMDHFRNRPEHTCSVFANALARTTNELWHPVKDRACLATTGWSKWSGIT